MFLWTRWWISKKNIRSAIEGQLIVQVGQNRISPEIIIANESFNTNLENKIIAVVYFNTLFDQGFKHDPVHLLAYKLLRDKDTHIKTYTIENGSLDIYNPQPKEAFTPPVKKRHFCILQ